MSASIRVADESINAAVAAAPPAVPDRPLKCVFIGECGVGKTSLLVTRVLGEFPSNYLPMITDNYDVQVPRPTRRSQAQPSLAQSSAAASASLAADSTTAATAATTVVAHTPDTFVKVVCWDTAGQEDYDRVRPLAYVGADCFAVCFSIGDPGSLENMRLRWHPELQHHAPSLPRLLVGLKSDLRTSEPSNERLATQPQPDQPLVTPEAAQAMAQEIGAAAYLECSAVTKAGMDALFERIAQVALAAEAKQKPRRCAIM